MSNSTTRENRIENLKKTQAARKQDAFDKVNKAIERLQKIGAKINFQTVAKEANVSVPYLYKYPELKVHIAQLRSQQTQMPSSPVIQPPVTAKAHFQIVERLKKRIQELDKENTELKRKNEALAGQVYRVHFLQSQIERQQEIIESLSTRLKEANEQITSTKVIPITSSLITPISDEILAELESVGISLNNTLIKEIKASTLEKVLAAIAAYKEQRERTNIENPVGWLVSAIKGGWTKIESTQQQRCNYQPAVFESPTPSNREIVSKEELGQISKIFEEITNE